jgi:hypothetical protein
VTPTILVATWNDGLFTITPNSRTQEFPNQPVRGLAPDNHGNALAIINGHTLSKRAPNGQWTTIATSDLELSCCIAVRETIYVGTDDARILRLNNERGTLDPIDSFNQVPGRETWFAGSAIVNGQRLGPPLGIRSLAANANGTVLFANVHVGGIPRSLDAGKTWHPTIDIKSDIHEVRAHPTDPNLIAAAADIGLCISRDAGATWSIETEGLHTPRCYATAFCGDEILVSASINPFAAPGKIYRRPIKQDGRITPVENGLHEWTNGKVDTACIATKGTTIAIADSAGTLYLSTQTGQAFSQISNQLPTPSSVLIC